MSSHVLSSMQVDSVQVSHLRICLLKRVVVSTESEDSARPLYSVNVNHIIHSIKRTITTMKITGNLSSFQFCQTCGRKRANTTAMPEYKRNWGHLSALTRRESMDWPTMMSRVKANAALRIHIAGAHRVFYLATRPEDIYVLHAFEKKTQKTSAHDSHRRADALLQLKLERLSPAF